MGVRSWWARTQVRGSERLALRLQAAFLANEDPRLLDASLVWTRRAVAYTPPDSPELAERLSTMGDVLCMRYERNHDVAGLEQALAIHRGALTLVAAVPAHPHLYTVYTGLGSALSHLAQRDSDLAVTDEAIGYYRAALEDPADDPDLRAMRLVNLSHALELRCLYAADLSSLDEAIELLRTAVSLTPTGSHFYPWRASRLASAMAGRAALGGDSDPASGVTEVLDQIRAALPGALPSFAEQARILIGPLLAGPPATDAPGPETGEPTPAAVLEEVSAIVRQSDARTMAPLYQAGNVAGMLRRAAASGDPRLFDEAVATARDAVASTPDDHPFRYAVLGLLGAALGQRMEWLGRRDDLPEMVDVLRRAVAASPADDPARGGFQSDLGNALVLSFDTTGDLATLTEAVATFRAAAAALPDDFAEPGIVWTNLGGALLRLHERTSDAPALDEAIDAHHRAVASATATHVNRGMYASNLSGALSRRWRDDGDIADLDEAIRFGRLAAEAAGTPPATRPLYLGNLGEALAERGLQTGQTESLDEAVRVFREVTTLMPAGHVARPKALHMLGNALIVTGEESGATIDEAVRVLREAVAAEPSGSTQRTLMLNSLGRSLVLRAQHAESDGRRRAVLAELAAVLAGGEAGEPFARATEQTGANEGAEIAALDEAVSVLTEAIADRSATAADRSLSVGSLGSALWIRYRLTGKARNLNRAARELRRATVEAPLPGRIHAVALSYLGRVLMDVWRRRHDDRTRAEAEEALRASVAVEVAPADFRAFVARLLGDFIVETGRPAEAVEAYATAVGLLEAIAWRGLSRPDQERLLAEFEDVAVDAAACALTAGRPRLAVELLEQGRGVLLTQVIDGRSGYDRLRAAAPEPAERLRAVQDELGARSAEGGDQPDADRVHALVREQDRLLAEIRELPGFADFLRPPAFERLSAGAGGGPLVIVNVSRLRCDAITVTPDDVRVTALPGLDHAEVGRRADELLRFVAGRDGDRRRPEAELGEILGWLWDVIAAPILADLDVAGPDTRLWWCPTGRLAILPLHAAGRHGAGGRDTVLDRVVSSYTPTARALLHARPPRAAASTGTRALVVAMPHTEGYADLPGAEEELAEVTARYPDATLAVGPAATRAAVLAAVAGCDLAHFACHAAHDLNAPSASRLLLHDRPLTVRDLVAHRAGQAELAYLSACETFSGSRRLPDEAISLAGTVQLAGFRQVIGTLWAVSDRYAPRVARAVYAGIAEAGDLTGTAAALHDAVRSLRDRRPAAPSLWAPYVHIGP